MPKLLEFRNVSLFKDKPFGVSGISFIIRPQGRYVMRVDNGQALETLAGLIEQRFKKQSGYVERKDKLFVQSDRLLLGEKEYDKTPRKYLALSNEFFKFGGKQRSKTGFIETIRAKTYLDFPIYKLDPAHRLKFTLLALAFQETGIVLISHLLTKDLDADESRLLWRIINESHAACCLIHYGQVKDELFSSIKREVETIDFRSPAAQTSKP